ncbi:MAG TPA: flagellar biosynthesis anti-sigma factor FlgM [Desulfonatronum sp.]|nr:flagellar biosynthesis anti-sigma factor FlgM [Desulfonatronum sp.]
MQIKNLTEMFRPVDNTDNRSQKNKAGRSDRDDSSAVAGGDRVSLSRAAQQYKLVQQTARNSPDVRAEMVGQIKGQVANGTYELNSRKTAEKMMEQEFALWNENT